MGKKGTKRKTKWRALPLGEEAAGSGNEEDLHDEDQSTTSSVAGGQPGITFRRQSFYYKMADKPFRQTRRFAHDKFRGKEPLVKLESKTFDEEEYTKITTPRQDVLFKKGYFGRKRESSVEGIPPHTGEMDSEELMMEQIIITNGFVDERGHYLVNGNSYEIYDPYSNTVTVVVGPPPYANGVSQPVLAAVSCQPVPLQPVEWFPPGADWPAQGSAWTPSYSRTTHPDSAAVPDGTPNFPSPEAQIPSLYNQPAYVVPGYAYSESPLFNGVPLQTNSPAEAQTSEENRIELKKTRRKSTESIEEERDREKEKQTNSSQTAEEMNSNETNDSDKNSAFAQGTSEVVSSLPSSFCENQISFAAEATQRQTELRTIPARQVEKHSHSTQTNLLEGTVHPGEVFPGKESHSTQTPPEETLGSNYVNSKAQERSTKRLSDDLISLLPKTEGEKKQTWKTQGSRFSNSVKKFREESPRKTCQKRTNFIEERKLNLEKSDSSPFKVSYAKKAMSGLENMKQNSNPNMTTSPKFVGNPPEKVVNGGFKNQTQLVNGTNMNGMNRGNSTKQMPAFEDKRNGFIKARYTRGKPTTQQTSPKYKNRKFERKVFDEEEKKFEEAHTNGSHSPSEKSSTISESSSPNGLSSGQNTPPEKVIAQETGNEIKEINKNFEEKLKENLEKSEEEKEIIKEEQQEEKPKGKKKKNKEHKSQAEKPKELKREKKKKKKRSQGEAKEKSESENSSEEIAFLSNIREKDFFFGSWEGLRGEGEDFVSEMSSLLNGDKEILKSLGLNGDRKNYSKLPLHADPLFMLPTFGWARPKLNIEDLFTPHPCGSDLFTKRNITSMKSTKPEEFFASVIESPAVDKTEKKKESQKKILKSEESATPSKKTSKSGCKANKKTLRKADQNGGAKKPDVEVKEGNLGIVEAVNTWLQEQSDSEKFISVESFKSVMAEQENVTEEADQKNGASNPIHAPSRDGGSASVADFREDGGCMRVANVISDDFVHVSREFSRKKTSGRMYRSSSWDTKLSEGNIKKHLKFLTDSASFCQDLISDVRNGLPTGNEFATEELCDPRQTVAKYYTLAPSGRLRSESDSENEAFDALEYTFLTKENQEAEGKNPDGNGNASITDSGVHSDMESSEDNVTELQKETTCKLQ